MMPLLVGIDVGTGSTKGVLATPEGDVVAGASRAHGMSMPRPGWFEVDAESVWWRDITEISHELMAAAGDRPIAGVGISGVGPALVLLDEHRRPVRPAILYGIDSRAEAEIGELNARYGEEQLLARCGKRLSSQALGPKLLWVQRHEPDAWTRAATWSTCSGFAIARLTGGNIIDHHTASQCDPMYDLSGHDWSEWAEDLSGGLPLPRLAWSTDVIGTVTSSAAVETVLPAGTPVVAGTVDAWAEGFSAGARHAGDLMLMYGSTMFFVQVLPELRRHPLLWATAGVEPGSRTLAAGMSTSGTLTQWVQTLTGGASFETLVAEAAAVPPGSDGLVLLPYFAGERTPVFDPRARGVLAGLHLGHTRGHLFRAVYEGIGYGVRQVLELLTATAQPAQRIFAVGGGTQGGLWTQIVSDVTGSEQLVPTRTIGASYGDALLAAIGTEVVPPETDWNTVAQTVHPHRELRELYDELFQVYGDLYPATRGQVHRLSEVQARLHPQA